MIEENAKIHSKMIPTYKLPRELIFLPIIDKEKNRMKYIDLRQFY
jgi:hypothetical protein